MPAASNPLHQSNPSDQGKTHEPQISRSQNCSPAGIVLAAPLVAACGKLDGTYADKTGLLEIDFKSSDKANLNTMAGKIEVDYEVNGKEVKTAARPSCRFASFLCMPALASMDRSVMRDLRRRWIWLGSTRCSGDTPAHRAASGWLFATAGWLPQRHNKLLCLPDNS